MYIQDQNNIILNIVKNSEHEFKTSDFCDFYNYEFFIEMLHRFCEKHCKGFDRALHCILISEHDMIAFPKYFKEDKSDYRIHVHDMIPPGSIHIVERSRVKEYTTNPNESPFKNLLYKGN